MHKIDSDWQQARAEIFWGEIAPTDHVVQIYDNDQAFLEALAGFAGGGINAGETVVIVATEQHLASLETIFLSLGVDTKTLISESRYIPLQAEKILQKFMVDGWPDEVLFNKTVTEILSKARSKSRKVRVFGEMVAVLWGQGMNGATVQLEDLWNKFAENENFCLFCAYPKAGFTESPKDSMHSICCTHTKVINGEIPSMTEVMFKPAV
jgi:hypothetical protein